MKESLPPDWSSASPSSSRATGKFRSGAMRSTSCSNSTISSGSPVQPGARRLDQPTSERGEKSGTFRAQEALPRVDPSAGTSPASTSSTDRVSAPAIRGFFDHGSRLMDPGKVRHRSSDAKVIRQEANVRDTGTTSKSPHQFVVLLRVEVAVSVQHDRNRGVAGHRSDMLRVSPSATQRRRRSVGDRGCGMVQAGCSDRRRRTRRRKSVPAPGIPPATRGPGPRDGPAERRGETARRRRTRGVAPFGPRLFVFGGPKVMWPPMLTSVSAMSTRRRRRSTRFHRRPSISPSRRPPNAPLNTKDRYAS